MKWASWIMTALVAGMLIMSGVMKFMGGPGLDEGFGHLGIPVSQRIVLGCIELACVALYLFPRTSYLGAILITGYMGGAIEAHMRVGDPPVVQFLLGVLAWGAIYLRDPRLSDLIPLRK